MIGMSTFAAEITNRKVILFSDNSGQCFPVWFVCKCMN